MGGGGFKWLMIATAIMNGLFLAFTPVSGSPSSEESCTDIYASLSSFTLEKGGTPGWIFVSFVADMNDMCSFGLLTSLAQILYQTAAYCICILMI